MAAVVVFMQGIFELVGLGSFLIGYFGDIWWLMMLGGCLVMLDDTIDMATGVLKPLFPVALAILLAIVLTPWYVGVFWASAAFKVLGIPASLKMVFAPKQSAVRALRRTRG